jgi:hypothetical protein
MTWSKAAAGEAAGVSLGGIRHDNDLLLRMSDLAHREGRIATFVARPDTAIILLQRLARRNALVGVRCDAEFFDVGVPEGYRQAVAAFPAVGGTW